MLIITLWLTAFHAHSQTKDLNSPERVAALYKINEQRKAYRDQIKHCKKASDSLTKIAIELGDKSEEYASHNLDLQTGLVGLLKENADLELENQNLKSKKKKFISVGPYAGYDVFKNNYSAGISVQYTFFSF